jgi:hypothetical protein
MTIKQRLEVLASSPIAEFAGKTIAYAEAKTRRRYSMDSRKCAPTANRHYPGRDAFDAVHLQTNARA